MATERTDIPWGQGGGGATYHGFSGAPTPPPMAERPARVRRLPRKSTVGVGVLAAVVMGLVLGFLAKPNLGHPRASAPMRSVSPSAAAMDVEVNAPTPPLPVKSAGKLEVLPPGAAQFAQGRFAPSMSPAIPPANAAVSAPPPILPVTPRAPNVLAPPLTQVPAVAAGDTACSAVRSRAAQMVCVDPELAAADRELNRAYRRAMRSGVPTEQLRDEQRDWLAIREDAARRSPRAVADVYEQRINELNQIAEDGPGD